MNPWDWLTFPLADRLASVLLHFTWQALAVAAMLLLAVRVFGLKAARSKHAASLIALITLAVLPFITWFALSSIRNEAEVASAQIWLSSQRIQSALTDHEVPLFAWRTHLLLTWAGGVGLLSLRLLVSACAVLWLRSVSRPLPSSWQTHLSPVLRGLYRTTDHLVRVSDQVTEAVAVGLIRPLVLLPATWLTELPPDVLRAVLAHELAHLRRGDLWVTLLQRVLEIVFFYHPVVWWLSRRISEEREICCDELAAAVIGDPVAYSQALEQAARQQLAGASPSLAACLFGGDSMALLKRVRHVLGIAEGGRQPLGLLAMFGSLLLGIAMLGLNNSPPRAVADEPREEAKERRREAAESKDFVQRGEERREGDRPGTDRREGERREEDRQTDVRRDGERREGDRPAADRAAGDRREGDRPATRREDARREGDRPAVDRREGDGRKPNDRVRNREPEVAELERRNAESRELASIVQDLRAEVRQLRAQVAELQERVSQRKGDLVQKAREGADDAKREANERKEQMIRELKERLIKERESDAKTDEAGRIKEAIREKLRKEGTGELPRKEIAKPGEKRTEARKEGDRPDEKPRKDVGKPEAKKDLEAKPSKKEGEVRKDGSPYPDKPRKEGEKTPDKPAKEFKPDEKSDLKKDPEKPRKEADKEDSPRPDKK